MKSAIEFDNTKSFSRSMLAGHRLAYIILAHSDPVHFARLIKRLSCPQVVFIVHIDAKTDLQPFIAAVEGMENIHFVPNRIRVMWAAYSVVEATLRCIELASSSTNDECSHFVLLSGACYPIATNERILSFFSGASKSQFLRRFDIFQSNDPLQTRRLLGFHFRELSDRRTMMRRPLYILENLLKIFPRRIDPVFRFTCGSQWWALTREFAIYCLEEARSNILLKQQFRFSFAPDELFFSSLLDSSRFSIQASEIEPYLSPWPGGPWNYGNVHFLNPNDPIRTRDEIQTILVRHSKALFARKFSSIESFEALEYLDKILDESKTFG